MGKSWIQQVMTDQDYTAGRRHVIGLCGQNVEVAMSPDGYGKCDSE